MKLKPRSTARHLLLTCVLTVLAPAVARAATVTKAATGTDLTSGASWGGTGMRRKIVSPIDHTPIFMPSSRRKIINVFSIIETSSQPYSFNKPNQ
jgi:hypothetical protein